MADIASKGMNLRDKAQDVAANVGHKAQDLASTAADKADTTLSSVGESMTSLAGTIREKAPQEGMVGSAATAVAQGLQSSGQFLKEHQVSDIGEGLTALIRNHPMSSLCVAFSLGWLMGMASRR